MLALQTPRERRRWVESRHAGFLAIQCVPRRLRDPNAVFSEKVRTIPALT